MACAESTSMSKWAQRKIACSDTVNHHQTDIMVMGASSHGRLHRTLVGSTAATILESLPCDFLIVQPDDAS